MISAKRIAGIFRRRGGAHYANLAQNLNADQVAYLEGRARGEPIIAMMSSSDQWFVLTQSHLVMNRAAELQ